MKTPTLIAPFLALFVATLFGVGPRSHSAEFHLAVILPIFLLLVSWNALGKAVRFFLMPPTNGPKISRWFQFLFALFNLLFLTALTFGLITYIHPRIDLAAFYLLLGVLILPLLQTLALKRKYLSLLPPLSGLAAGMTVYLGFMVLSGVAWIWPAILISLSVTCALAAFELALRWSELGSVKAAKVLGVLLFLTPLSTFTLCMFYALAPSYLLILALIPLCGKVVLQAARAAKTPRDSQHPDVKLLPIHTVAIYYLYLLAVALLGLFH